MNPEDINPNVLSDLIRALNEKTQLESDLRAEIARLKAGRFTPEEFQNLCHNKDELACTEREFCDGCEEYQKKLFGRSQIADLRSHLGGVEMLLCDTLEVAYECESWMRCECGHPACKRCRATTEFNEVEAIVRPVVDAIEAKQKATT